MNLHVLHKGSTELDDQREVVRVMEGGGGTLGGEDIGEFKLPLVDGDVEEVGDLEGLETEALVEDIKVLKVEDE
ncbi:hypothetical protein Tco_0784031 [Tanacetum coccineum]